MTVKQGDSVGFWISIPILAREYYTLWKVLTVPFPDYSAHSQIEPKTTNMGGRVKFRENNN